MARVAVFQMEIYSIIPHSSKLCTEFYLRNGVCCAIQRSTTTASSIASMVVGSILSYCSHQTIAFFVLPADPSPRPSPLHPITSSTMKTALLLSSLFVGAQAFGEFPHCRFGGIVRRLASIGSISTLCLLCFAQVSRGRCFHPF